MSKQDLGPLGHVDLLTNHELHETMGHHIDHAVKDWYRGLDFLVFAGPGNGTNTITLPGPDSGYAWSFKGISAQLATPADTVAPVGYYAQGQATNPAAGTVIAQLTGIPAGYYYLSATLQFTGTPTASDFLNVYLQQTGGNAPYIQSGITVGTVYTYGPVLWYLSGYVQAKNTILGTAGYNVSLSAQPEIGAIGPSGAVLGAPSVLSVYPSDNTNVAPVGVATAVPNNGNNDAVITWSGNQVVLKDSRNLTLMSSAVINNWRMAVLQVPTEMQGKLNALPVSRVPLRGRSPGSDRTQSR